MKKGILAVGTVLVAGAVTKVVANQLVKQAAKSVEAKERNRTEVSKVLEGIDMRRMMELDRRQEELYKLEKQLKLIKAAVFKRETEQIIDGWVKEDGSDHIYKIATFDEIVATKLSVATEEEVSDLIGLFLNRDIQDITNNGIQYHIEHNVDNRMILKITGTKGEELYDEVLREDQWVIVKAIVKDLIG